MRKLASILLLIIWLFLIFSFSANDGEKSSSMSDNVIKFFVHVLTDIEDDSEEMEDIINKYSFPVRKAAHFTEYFILGVIVLNLLVSFDVKRKVLIYTAIFCILASIMDEFHQSFVEGRNGNIGDVLLDSSGSLIGSYLVCRFYLFKESLKSH